MAVTFLLVDDDDNRAMKNMMMIKCLLFDAVGQAV